MSDLRDEELALQAQNGDLSAFSALVARYEAKLLRYARKFLFSSEDGEDLVQDVFIKAYRNIQSFDATRSFSSWIYRIAHNEFINALKKKTRQPLTFLDFDTFFPQPRAAETADKDLHDTELRHILDTCLDRLDPKYREPLILFYYEELDYREIAEILHLPVPTVGVRLKRAKEKLREAYSTLVP